MREPKEFDNVIGGKHTISQNTWALSLVRKANAEHAYLILEGINEEDERIFMDAHLVVKEGSNDKLADIVQREISVANVIKVGEGCSSYTWNINRHQVESFIALVQSEKQRADEGKLNYLQNGKAPINGVLASLPDKAKAGLNKHSDNSCTDSLLKTNGHNCGSWAIAMIKAQQLEFRTSFIAFFANVPMLEVRGTHDGNVVEPTTRGCSVM